MSNIESVLLSHQIAAQRGIDVLSGNLASNMRVGGQTTGLQFQEVMHRAGKKTAHYVQDGNLFRNTSGGNLNKSKNPLDFALIGKGYFKIQKNDEIIYQRGGNFRLNTQRQIVNDKNLLVLSEADEAIMIPIDKNVENLSIAGDFTISIDNEIIGKMGLARFTDEKEVTLRHDGFYESKAEPSGPYDENGIQQTEIQQFASESSNMSMASFLMKLITYHRNFDANQKALEREHKRELSLIDGLMKTPGNN